MTLTQNDHLLDDERVNETARRKFRAVLADVRKGGAGLPLVVVEVYRSQERQWMLFCQGRGDEACRSAGVPASIIRQARASGYTSRKPVVTRAVKSNYHATGRAMDCAWLVDGAITWSAADSWWQTYGHAGRTHELVWGGDWKRFRDKPHLQWEGVQ